MTDELRSLFGFKELPVKRFLSLALLMVCALPARAQFSDSMGYSYNNMMSATIGTWLNGQSSMFYSRQQLYRSLSAAGGRSRPTAYAITLRAIALTPPGRVLSDGLPKIAASQRKAAQQQFALVLAQNTGFRGLSDREKQEAYEMFQIMPAMAGLLYSVGLEKHNAKAQSTAQQLARENLQNIFCVAPEKMRFTQEGLQL